MGESKSLLFLSNGHGEDVAAAAVIDKLRGLRDDLLLKAMPIVGNGTAYREKGVEIIGPLAQLPTGGFMRLGFKNLLMDLRGGLLGLTLKQINTLKKAAANTDLAVACGDAVPVLLASLFLRKPVFFIATAKSQYISGHYKVEKCIMKRLTCRVFTRDEATAEDLRQWGVRARFPGNPVLDALNIKGESFGIQEPPGAIGFLPGSREDAYIHLDFFLRVAEKMESIKPQYFKYLFSFYPGLDPDRMKAVLAKSGWVIGGSADIYWTLRKGQTKILLVKGLFGDIINKSSLVIGLSGTGNEQAAGCGKPVVSFPSGAMQYNERFLRGQKKLLGECLAVVEADPLVVAREALGILEDRPRYRRMARCGAERMGPKGGAESIAREISFFLT